MDEKIRVDEMVFCDINHKITCFFCDQELSSELPFFKNVDKTHQGKPIHMCPDCISSGVEFEEHTCQDRLEISENLSTISIFCKEWSAREELLLLEGFFSSLYCVCVFFLKIRVVFNSISDLKPGYFIYITHLGNYSL